MTEREWRTCADLEQMLGYLGDGLGKRKARLFAVACGRRVWPLLDDPRSLQALAVAEQYADRGKRGPPTRKDLRQAELAAWAVAHALNGGPDNARWNAAQAATEVASTVAMRAARNAAAHAAFTVPRRQGEEHAAQADLVREIFGNPFRPVAVDPTWQSPTVALLAEAAYTERGLQSGHLDSSRLAILADAVEEAGCDDPDLLGHLRSAGPHVRGCWAVDLILGRT